MNPTWSLNARSLVVVGTTGTRRTSPSSWNSRNAAVPVVREADVEHDDVWPVLRHEGERDVAVERLPGAATFCRRLGIRLLEEHREHIHGVFARIEYRNGRHVGPSRRWHREMLAYFARARAGDRRRLRRSRDERGQDPRWTGCPTNPLPDRGADGEAELHRVRGGSPAAVAFERGKLPPMSGESSSRVGTCPGDRPRKPGRSWRYTLAVALLACSDMPFLAQTWPFPWPEDRIARYTARRTSSPLVIDGRLDEAAWQAAERSPRFADLIGGRPGIHDTRAAVLWDDTYLYVGYWVEEPFVEATLTERDAPIYKNNDVELFIAGRDAYYEFEINAFGTIYEVFFIWEREFESSGYARRPEFDRSRTGVRPFNGVRFKKHPRGPRIGYWNWDMPGLETAIHVDGTINDNKDRDRGWTAELRIPWRSLEPLAMPDGRALPPRDGDEWRMDFSRFNQYKEAPPAKDPGGWAWSPHGVWDSHIPELFTRVRFSTEPVGRK